MFHHSIICQDDVQWVWALHKSLPKALRRTPSQRKTSPHKTGGLCNCFPVGPGAVTTRRCPSRSGWQAGSLHTLRTWQAAPPVERWQHKSRNRCHLSAHWNLLTQVWVPLHGFFTANTSVILDVHSHQSMKWTHNQKAKFFRRQCLRFMPHAVMIQWTHLFCSKLKQTFLIYNLLNRWEFNRKSNHLLYELSYC
jgi:hypothetical protein